MNEWRKHQLQNNATIFITVEGSRGININSFFVNTWYHLENKALWLVENFARFYVRIFLLGATVSSKRKHFGLLKNRCFSNLNFVLNCKNQGRGKIELLVIVVLEILSTGRPKMPICVLQQLKQKRHKNHVVHVKWRDWRPAVAMSSQYMILFVN